ncbi:M15 family metallopeptidase [Zhenpiania hominis]|uniref:M15 family metallopeptidase n=1 Tax=Zhenpiania hominis TaxID=2763644 RepID=A0A923NGE6_9FIRM|nr:M15 family metallopeptidase [Zhenpiania hominis]MBC6678511.1 M15 family metallopeptidase [Zhenpiania hominis]
MRNRRKRAAGGKQKGKRLLLMAVIILLAAGMMAFKGGIARTADESLGWNLMLVNSQYRIPDDYSMDLIRLSNGEQVDSRIYPALQEMFDDARADGYNLFVRAGYRNGEVQENLMEDKIETYRQEGYSQREAEHEAEKWVAKPGTSEHELGLAVDINAEGQTDGNRLYQWLAEHSWKYGFILRYPAEKEEITGIDYEPWHFRYVGKQAAKEMYEQDLCLEEYVQ